VILDAVKAAVAVFLLAILQLSAMPQLVPGSVTPDLLLILVVAVALTRGAEAAALTGFAAGVLIDAMLVGRMGLTSLLYMAAGLWVAYRVDPSEPGVVPTAPQMPRRIVQVLYVVAAEAIVQVGMAGVNVLLGDGYPVSFELFNVIVPTVIETGLVAIVLLPLLLRLFPYRARVDGYPVAAA
jgi:cell shape-determining protein MreD